MKTTKGKNAKGTDIDEAIARPGLESRSKNEIPKGISLDTIIAEKDEVKIAEERLRKQNKKRQQNG